MGKWVDKDSEAEAQLMATMRRLFQRGRDLVEEQSPGQTITLQSFVDAFDPDDKLVTRFFNFFCLERCPRRMLPAHRRPNAAERDGANAANNPSPLGAEATRPLATRDTDDAATTRATSASRLAAGNDSVRRTRAIRLAIAHTDDPAGADFASEVTRILDAIQQQRRRMGRAEARATRLRELGDMAAIRHTPAAAAAAAAAAGTAGAAGAGATAAPATTATAAQGAGDATAAVDAAPRPAATAPVERRAFTLQREMRQLLQRRSRTSLQAAVNPWALMDDSISLDDTLL